MEKRIIKIPIGDWSDDGHGKCNVIVIESTHPARELQEAYKSSCKLTGVQFNHNENYTGLELDYGSERMICTEYEDSRLSELAIDIFKDFNCPHQNILDDGYLDTNTFVTLLLWFISLSMPEDWEYDMIEQEGEYLNGYWNKNLNVQFGYGLFY